jgi:hypothetical protein
MDGASEFEKLASKNFACPNIIAAAFMEGAKLCIGRNEHRLASIRDATSKFLVTEILLFVFHLTAMCSVLLIPLFLNFSFPPLRCPIVNRFLVPLSPMCLPLSHPPGGIDPEVFIDDDRQGYRYLNSAVAGKLKPNMIELAEPMRSITQGPAPIQNDPAGNFNEGSSMLCTWERSRVQSR